MPRNRSQSVTATLDRIHSEFSTQNLENSFASMEVGISPAERRAVAKALRAAEGDPYGDADQSNLPDPTHHPLRAAWATGLDYFETIFSEEHAFSLHRSAWQADLEDVDLEIGNARAAVRKGHTHALTKLLESRLSQLRLTPLHYVCQGARTLRDDASQDVSDNFYKVAESLLKAGANPNARDIAGYPPLSTAAGFMTTSTSLRIAKLLVAHGADVNARTRFQEGFLAFTIMGNNLDAFAMLLRAGADLSLADATGLTPARMIRLSPRFLQVASDVQRERVANGMKCGSCDASGATKVCSGCRKAFYCSRDCQRNAWRTGHRAQCGKEGEHGIDFVDVVVDRMTLLSLSGVGVASLNKPMFTNSLNGASSSEAMRKDGHTEGFTVKVSVAGNLNEGASVDICVKVNVENSDYLLIHSEGEAKQVHERLTESVMEKGMNLGKAYFSAKWLDTDVETLRIFTSVALPPPAPLW